MTSVGDPPTPPERACATSASRARRRTERGGRRGSTARSDATALKKALVPTSEVPPEAGLRRELQDQSEPSSLSLEDKSTYPARVAGPLSGVGAVAPYDDAFAACFTWRCSVMRVAWLRRASRGWRRRVEPGAMPTSPKAEWRSAHARAWAGIESTKSSVCRATTYAYSAPTRENEPQALRRAAAGTVMAFNYAIPAVLTCGATRVRGATCGGGATSKLAVRGDVDRSRSTGCLGTKPVDASTVEAAAKLTRVGTIRLRLAQHGVARGCGGSPAGSEWRLHSHSV
eukprot:scaffold196669_cov28-Tisochrysis_lutea.AAC.8